MAVGHHIRFALCWVTIFRIHLGGARKCCQRVQFSDNAHGFAQNGDASRNWLLAKDSPLWHRAPGKDYSFINFHYPFSANDSSSLISPLYELSLIELHQPCMFTFTYYLDGGSNSTSLSLFLSTADVQRELIWEENSSESAWQVARVSIFVGDPQYKLEFHGLCGEGCSQLVNIALSNLTSSCCFDPAYTTDRGSCSMATFDNGLDGFQQSEDDDMDWWRRYGTSSTKGTGPPADHTTGHGAFMYLETTGPYHHNHLALLLSPNWNRPVSASCTLSFWYHMRGSLRMGTLAVYIITPMAGLGNDTLVWAKTGHQGNEWHRAVLRLKHVNSTFQVVFKAMRGKSSKGDIAIDDVTLSASCCQQMPPHRSEDDNLKSTGSPTETLVRSETDTTTITVSHDQKTTSPDRPCSGVGCADGTTERQSTDSSSGPSLTLILLCAMIVLAAILIIFIICILYKLRRLRSEAQARSSRRGSCTKDISLPMAFVASKSSSGEGKAQSRHVNAPCLPYQLSGEGVPDEDDILPVAEGTVSFDNPMFTEEPQYVCQLQPVCTPQANGRHV